MSSMEGSSGIVRSWKNTHRRFCRWRDKGIWEKLMEQLIGERELEWIMIDASYVKAHMYACGVRGENRGIARTKRAALHFSDLI